MYKFDADGVRNTQNTRSLTNYDGFDVIWIKKKRPFIRSIYTCFKYELSSQRRTCPVSE